MRTEYIIKEMFYTAWRHSDREMAIKAYQLLQEITNTEDCPQSWQGMSERIAKEIINIDMVNNWIKKYCDLRDFLVEG